MASQSESLLKSKMKKFIVARGGFWCSIPQNGYAKTGDPDMVVCYRGHFIGLEAKYFDGTLRPMQLTRRTQIQEAGGMFIAPRSVEELGELFDAIDAEMDAMKT